MCETKLNFYPEFDQVVAEKKSNFKSSYMEFQFASPCV